MWRDRRIKTAPTTQGTKSPCHNNERKKETKILHEIFMFMAGLCMEMTMILRSALSYRILVYTYSFTQTQFFGVWPENGHSQNISDAITIHRYITQTLASLRRIINFQPNLIQNSCNFSFTYRLCLFILFSSQPFIIFAFAHFGKCMWISY